MAAAFFMPSSMAFVHSARLTGARVSTRSFGSTVVRRLSMISTDVKGSPDTESFRLFFKVRTSSQPHLEAWLHESI